MGDVDIHHIPVIDVINAGYLSVGSGDQCVFLMEHSVPKWRNATMLTPAAARQLAAGLILMADQSETVGE